MSSAPTVTLISVTFNSGDVLRSCWGPDGIPPGCRWIVVDNDSRDDSADYAESLGASVVRLDENVGFSKANNRAMSMVSDGVIGFLNPDVTPDATQIGRLVRHLEVHGGFVAPQLLEVDGRRQPNGRSLPTLGSKLLHRIAPQRGSYRRFAAPGASRRVSWAMGAALFGQVEDFRSIGGWNERFFIYYEDADISLRASRAGLMTTVCGSATLTHGWARETAGASASAWRNEVRAASIFYRLHPGLLLPAVMAKRLNSYRRNAEDATSTCQHV
jgi:N-acetylglucosaminyl-diphospho-decaprenol L-rhamnosyltransferase